jgi:hypothetical protein
MSMTSGFSSRQPLMNHSSSRRLTSVAIHSRAWIVEEYRTPGLLPSALASSFAVSRSAMISRGVSGPSPSGSVP